MILTFPQKLHEQLNKLEGIILLILGGHGIAMLLWSNHRHVQTILDIQLSEIHGHEWQWILVSSMFIWGVTTIWQKSSSLQWQTIRFIYAFANLTQKVRHESS